VRVVLERHRVGQTSIGVRACEGRPEHLRGFDVDLLRWLGGRGFLAAASAPTLNRGCSQAAAAAAGGGHRRSQAAAVGTFATAAASTSTVVFPKAHPQRHSMPTTRHRSNRSRCRLNRGRRQARRALEMRRSSGSKPSASLSAEGYMLTLRALSDPHRAAIGSEKTLRPRPPTETGTPAFSLRLQRETCRV